MGYLPWELRAARRTVLKRIRSAILPPSDSRREVADQIKLSLCQYSKDNIGENDHWYRIDDPLHKCNFQRN